MFIALPNTNNNKQTTVISKMSPSQSSAGWGGDSTYERGGDAHRKFWIKPLKETDLGVAQAFFDP